jgi:predicted TIM-barrel fold metal-dependent hydrolase
MQFTDFTVHMARPSTAGMTMHTSDGAARQDLARMLDEIRHITRHDLPKRARETAKSITAAGAEHFNLMLMDETFLDAGITDDWIGELSPKGSVTWLIDPRRRDAEESVRRAADLGIRGIKFHAYMQALGDDQMAGIERVARVAEACGLWIAICCSYGTVKVYEHSGVRILAHLAQSIEKVPLIALHSGGAKVLDVMSIAIDRPNVIMDLSLSIPFWRGSSVEGDFAFAIRKVGAHRCMFSSDHPFIELKTALTATEDFLRSHKFADGDVHTILYETGAKLLAR